MSTYSASYNFPQEFLWGIAAPDGFITDRSNNVTLFSLREKDIKALSITLRWADFEPLKNNYAEPLIDSVRNLLSRIRSQNIEPLIILNLSAVPQWQNLEHKPQKDHFAAEKFNFATHLANALIPYTNYFAIDISGNAFFRGKDFTADIETHLSVRKYILSLSNSVKVGTIFSPQRFQKKRGGIRSLFQPKSTGLLQNSEMDFFGITADDTAYEGIQNLLKEARKPLFIYSDELSKHPPSERADILADKIFDSWHFYQKGWPLLGFFSGLNLNEDTQALEIFTSASKNNAFQISTENENLPEKWIRLLKD